MTSKSVVIALAGAMMIIGVAGCTAAPQQGASGQQSGAESAQSAAPSQAREPKRLEEKITVNLGDTFISDTTGTKAPTFTVTAGKTVGIHVLNVGVIEHELLFGREVQTVEDAPDGYFQSLFLDTAADVFVYMPEKIEIGTVNGLEEVELEAGGQLWIRTTFPEDAKGEWEFGCFVPGHYEAGMKAKLVIQ